jgi:hypothetical protein
MDVRDRLDQGAERLVFDLERHFVAQVGFLDDQW